MLIRYSYIIDTIFFNTIFLHHLDTIVSRCIILILHRIKMNCKLFHMNRSRWCKMMHLDMIVWKVRVWKVSCGKSVAGIVRLSRGWYCIESRCIILHHLDLFIWKNLQFSFHINRSLFIWIGVISSWYDLLSSWCKNIVSSQH